MVGIRLTFAKTIIFGDTLFGLTFLLQGVVSVVDRSPGIGSNLAFKAKDPCKIYSIRNNSPVTLESFISTIEGCCNRKVLKNIYRCSLAILLCSLPILIT